MYALGPIGSLTIYGETEISMLRIHKSEKDASSPGLAQFYFISDQDIQLSREKVNGLSHNWISDEGEMSLD